MSATAREVPDWMRTLAVARFYDACEHHGKRMRYFDTDALHPICEDCACDRWARLCRYAYGDALDLTSTGCVPPRTVQQFVANGNRVVRLAPPPGRVPRENTPPQRQCDCGVHVAAPYEHCSLRCALFPAEARSRRAAHRPRKSVPWRGAVW